jgi:hypothetical protein
MAAIVWANGSAVIDLRDSEREVSAFLIDEITFKLILFNYVRPPAWE